MVMRFLLVCEGSSDAALIPHIRLLVDRLGGSDWEGTAWTRGRRLADKIENGLGRLGQFDLLFVHRDADRAGADVRYREITDAIQDAGYSGQWVGIVPVRMMEAWLLLDESAIRDTVGRSNRRPPLNLPSPREAERIADPKATLETALLNASEKRGRQRNRLRNNFPELRRRLLENLPVGGALEQLPSWVRFRDDTIRALQELNG